MMERCFEVQAFLPLELVGTFGCEIPFNLKGILSSRASSSVGTDMVPTKNWILLKWFPSGEIP
jgi:hypothetical protein